MTWFSPVDGWGFFPPFLFPSFDIGNDLELGVICFSHNHLIIQVVHALLTQTDKLKIMTKCHYFDHIQHYAASGNVEYEKMYICMLYA